MRSRNRDLIAGVTLVCLVSIANAQQSGPPTSFSAQIAPILAIHCNSCHGDQGIAGGLDTRTWASLMASGVVLAQDANESLLVQFIEGRRGMEHRMPLGGKPLDGSQIELIRRWIVHGAKDDPDTTPKYRVTLPRVSVDRSEHMRIHCKVPLDCYLVLALMDPKSGRVVRREAAAVQSAADGADVKPPGEWITWDLAPERDWPKRLRVELTIAYAATAPVGALLQVCDEIGQVRASAEFKSPTEITPAHE